MDTPPILDIDALLIIDMQRGFLTDMHELVARVERLTRVFPREKTWWLKYRNEPDSLYAKCLDWTEVMVPPQTDIVEPFSPDPNQIYEHLSYSPPKELLAQLKGLKQVAIAGVDTDACVFATAFSLWDRNIRPIILAHFCASSGGKQIHQAALDMLRRQFGVNSVTFKSV